MIEVDSTVQLATGWLQGCLLGVSKKATSTKGSVPQCLRSVKHPDRTHALATFHVHH